jgi:hypothetical protein
VSGFCSHCNPHAEHCCADDLDLGDVTLGANPVTSTDLEFHANQAVSILNEPDVRVTHEEQSACCSDEETCHESCTKGCKYRHFCIKGDICVSEKVTFRENGIEETESEGYADKNTVSVDTTDSGLTLGGDQECYCAEAETPIDIHPCPDDLPPTPPQINCGGRGDPPCPSGMSCQNPPSPFTPAAGADLSR